MIPLSKTCTGGFYLTEFGLNITNPKFVFGGEGRELERYEFISSSEDSDVITPHPLLSLPNHGYN